MSRLLESIRCENGKLQNLRFHQARMDVSFEVLFSEVNRIRLGDIRVPGNCSEGLYKCRVTYAETLETVDFEPYQLPEINSLQLVTDDRIDYSLKYANRSDLARLLEKKGDCDEILIVRNGLVTDTSYSNILFFDGENWFTPASPLLRGTRRQQLLCEGKITPADIRVADFPRFEHTRLINAMIRFEDAVDIGINCLMPV